jgi:hypothetical protein
MLIVWINEAVIRSLYAVQAFFAREIVKYMTECLNSAILQLWNVLWQMQGLFVSDVIRKNCF